MKSKTNDESERMNKKKKIESELSREHEKKSNKLYLIRSISSVAQHRMSLTAFRKHEINNYVLPSGNHMARTQTKNRNT